jgi:hypothetical protein
MTPISNKIYNGPPIKAILKTSGVGVATADTTATSRIAYLRFRVKKAALTTLRWLNRARMRGSSKVRPKAKTKATQKEIYFPTEIIGLIWAD